MDTAGDSATKRGIELAQALGFNIKVVRMKQGYDPAEIIFNNPKDWEEAVNSAKSIHDFYFETTLLKFDKTTLEGKKAISKNLLPIIKKIPNKIEQDIWIQRLSREINIKEENILRELEKTKIENSESFVIQPDKKAGEVTEEKKDKKDILEENILILSIKNPKNLDKINEEDIASFSPSASFAFNYFKTNGFEIKGVEDSDYRDKLNLMLAKSEADYHSFKDEKDVVEEFEVCLKELRKLILKRKLAGITEEIKKSEEENNDEKRDELSNDFHNTTKKLHNIESA
jgi:DNA primase